MPVPNIKMRRLIVRQDAADSHQEYKLHNTSKKGRLINAKTTAEQDVPVTNIKKWLIVVRQGTADRHKEYKSHNRRGIRDMLLDKSIKKTRLITVKTTVERDLP